MSSAQAARSFLRPLGNSTDTLVVGGLGNLALRHLREAASLEPVGTWCELSGLIGVPVCCLDACCGTPGSEVANRQLDGSAVFSRRTDPLLACDALTARGSGFGGHLWADRGARLAQPVVLTWTVEPSASGPRTLQGTVRVEFQGAGAGVAAALSVVWELHCAGSASGASTSVHAGEWRAVSAALDDGALVDIAVVDSVAGARLLVGSESWTVPLPGGHGAVFAGSRLGLAEAGTPVDVAWNWPPPSSDAVLAAHPGSDGVAATTPVWTQRILVLVLAALGVRVRGLATVLDVVGALARPAAPARAAAECSANAPKVIS